MMQAVLIMCSLTKGQEDTAIGTCICQHVTQSQYPMHELRLM